MYTVLGERFAGWPGALLALAVGALVPALVAVTLGAAYVEYADRPFAREAMQGARAGAWHSPCCEKYTTSQVGSAQK